MEANENGETTYDGSARSSEDGLNEVNIEVSETSTHVDPVQENSQNESSRQGLDGLREATLGPWPTEEEWKDLEAEILETYETPSSYFSEVNILDLLNICPNCLVVLYKAKIMTTSRLDNTGLKHNIDIVKIIAII